MRNKIIPQNADSFFLIESGIENNIKEKPNALSRKERAADFFPSRKKNLSVGREQKVRLFRYAR